MISRLHDHQHTINQDVNLKRLFIMNFTIKKGKHFSSLVPVLLRPDDHFGIYDVKIEFTFILPLQDYYSKLIGHGFALPRLRSERIGWRFIEDNRIEFCIYSESNYKFSFTRAFSVPIVFNAMSGMYEVKIKIHLEENCTFAMGIDKKAGETYASTVFEKIKGWLPIVLCKPYHGGDPVAEQDYYFTFTKID